MFTPRTTSLFLVVSLLLAAVQTGKAQSSDKRVYTEYAKWWKKNNDTRKNWIIRDKDGKRKNKAFYRPLNPPHVTAAEAEERGMVKDPTFVLGIAVGKEARAYPLYSIGELVNDTIGKTPIAASW